MALHFHSLARVASKGSIACKVDLVLPLPFITTSLGTSSLLEDPLCKCTPQVGNRVPIGTWTKTHWPGSRLLESCWSFLSKRWGKILALAQAALAQVGASLFLKGGLNVFFGTRLQASRIPAFSFLPAIVRCQSGGGPHSSLTLCCSRLGLPSARISFRTCASQLSALPCRVRV